MMIKQVTCVIAAAVAASVALADGNWQGQVVGASQNPAVLQQTIQGLSDADQVAFFKQVSAAIAKKAASPTEKAEAYANSVVAAIKGAKKENVTAILAEAFATIPPESLTAVNEKLSAEFKAVEGDQTKIANQVVDAVVARCKTADNAGARETFAILTFVRNDKALQDQLVAKLDEETQALAKDEWIGPALKGDYNPILGATGAEEAPELAEIGTLSLPSAGVAAILGGIGSDPKVTGEPAGGALFGGDDGTLEGPGDIWIFAKPRTAAEGANARFGTRENDETGRIDLDTHQKRGHKGDDDDYHPGGYQNQYTGF